MTDHYCCKRCGQRYDKCSCPPALAWETGTPLPTKKFIKEKNLTANDKQIGGEHYKSAYQHWDWATEHGLSYLAGCATKYLVRWRKKNGVEDLDKAAHYVEKLVETAELHMVEYPAIVFNEVDDNLTPEESIWEDTKTMLAAAGVSHYDLSWHAVMDIVNGDLEGALANIRQMLSDEAKRASRPEPSSAPGEDAGPSYTNQG